MSTAPVVIPSVPDANAILLATGFKPLGDDKEFWNPPTGGPGVTTASAVKMLVDHYNSGRIALSQKHFLQTSEFWLGASGPLLAAPMAVAGIVGFADYLPPPVAAAVTGFCAFLTVATPAGYKFARFMAKRYAAREGVTLPPEESGK